MESYEAKKPFSLEALAQEGVRIVKGPEAIEPFKLSLNGIDAKYPKQLPRLKKIIEDTANFCAAFVAGPVVTDSFVDHSERRMWRREMSRKYGAPFNSLYDENKLRINRLGGIKSWLEETAAHALRVFGQPSEKADRVAALSARFPDLANYDDLTSEQKVDLVGKVDEICREYIEIFRKR